MTKREYQLRGLDRATKKLYMWEDLWYAWNRAGFINKRKGPESWLKWAAKRWQVPMPKLILSAAGNQSYAQATYKWNTGMGDVPAELDHHEIHITPRHNNPAIVLHEMAHVIDDYYNDPEAAPHNPIFTGIYIDLLVSCGLWPKAAITASAEAAGVRWKKVRPPRKKKARH